MSERVINKRRTNPIYPDLNKLINQGNISEKPIDNAEDLENISEKPIDDAEDLENISEKPIADADDLEDNGILNFLGKHFWKSLIVIVSFVIIIAGYIYSHNLKKHSQLTLYHYKFNELKKDYQYQSEYSWKVINGTLFNHIFRGQEPLKPAVLNFVGKNDKVTELIERLSLVLIQSRVSTKCTVFGGIKDAQDIDGMKVYIEDFITRAIGKVSRCVHIPNIDRLKPSIGPYLHGLTDEISAPFKRVVYMLSVSVDLPSDDHGAEEALEQVLRVAWLNEMGMERFSALMSRIAVNVVVVR